MESSEVKDPPEALATSAEKPERTKAKQKTAYEIRLSLVGSERCIRDRRKDTSRVSASLAMVEADDAKAKPVSSTNAPPVPEFRAAKVLV